MVSISEKMGMDMVNSSHDIQWKMHGRYMDDSGKAGAFSPAMSAWDVVTRMDPELFDITNSGALRTHVSRNRWRLTHQGWS